MNITSVKKIFIPRPITTTCNMCTKITEIQNWSTQGLITCDRYEVRPTRLEITTYKNPCSCLHEIGSKLSADRSHSFRALNRHKRVQTDSNSDRYEIFFMKTRHLSRSTIDVAKNKENIVAGNKTLNADWNISKNMALVSFRPHVNTSENVHFGSSLNSSRSRNQPISVDLFDNLKY